MIISAIVAVANNGVIGRNNQMPWHMPADFRYFKRMTLNHHIIMGRKNYESIGRPLPKRTNIIITRNPDYKVEGGIIVHSLEEALTIARQNEDPEAFIIGGSEIYKDAMPLLDRLYITEIDCTPEGDVFFPDYGTNWKEVSVDAHLADEQNPFNYTFKVLERPKSYKP